MRILAFFIAALALLAACTPAGPAPNVDVGCSPGEIDASGNCAVASLSNADVFGAVENGSVASHAIEYSPGTTGFLARPSADGKYPAVVMIHEWWGLNDNIRMMAENLASHGYVVLAVDLYHGQVATDSGTAGKLAAEVVNNPGPAIENLRSAAEYLKGLDYVDPSKVASLGWCFGGGQSLSLALSGEALAATVIYYGQLTSDQGKLKSISWPVLGIFGENDTSIPAASVVPFKDALDGLGIENEIYVYPNVGHAFANPSGASFAPLATRDAWNKTLSFLDRHLKE